jgi:hypothetical protein
VYHGGTLLRIEPVEEGVCREGGHPHSVGGQADKRRSRHARRLRHRAYSKWLNSEYILVFTDLSHTGTSTDIWLFASVECL